MLGIISAVGSQGTLFESVTWIKLFLSLLIKSVSLKDKNAVRKVKFRQLWIELVSKLTTQSFAGKKLASSLQTASYPKRKTIMAILEDRKAKEADPCNHINGFLLG